MISRESAKTSTDTPSRQGRHERPRAVGPTLLDARANAAAPAVDFDDDDKYADVPCTD
jgi:hypothetical protein